MDALLKRGEVLAALGATVDHDLPVDHVPAGRESELGKVASERLSAPRLHNDVGGIDEHDRAEAVVLGLVGPLLPDGQLAS